MSNVTKEQQLSGQGWTGQVPALRWRGSFGQLDGQGVARVSGQAGWWKWSDWMVWRGVVRHASIKDHLDKDTL